MTGLGGVNQAYVKEVIGVVKSYSIRIGADQCLDISSLSSSQVALTSLHLT